MNKLHEDKERLIGAILLGNNMVNILASALATSLLIELFGDNGVAYATLGMTLLVLIFAEILPKTYAIRHANKMALAIAPIIHPVIVVFAPITMTISLLVHRLLAMFGATVTADETGKPPKKNCAARLNFTTETNPRLSKSVTCCARSCS